MEKSRESDRFYFLGLQNHCRWWLQSWNEKTVSPCKKSYDKPIQCIKKERYHFADNGPHSQSHGFPTVMHSCQSWTIKRAEHQTSDAFELWCWRRVLRVPWTASRSNQSNLKERSPEYSLEGLMLTLKLQYFGYLMWRADSLEKTLMLGKIEGRGRSRWQRMRWLMASSTQWTRVWANAGRIVKGREAWQAAVHGVTKSQAQLSDWTTTTTATKLWELVRGQ